MSTIPSVDRLSYLATDSTCDSTRGVVESLGRQVGGYLHARKDVNANSHNSKEKHAEKSLMLR